MRSLLESMAHRAPDATALRFWTSCHNDRSFDTVRASQRAVVLTCFTSQEASALSLAAWPSEMVTNDPIVIMSENIQPFRATGVSY